MSPLEHADEDLRLDAAAIEALAARVAELLTGQLPAQPPVTITPGRLLSAAEVSEWWGVRRGWVYEHAGELGAIRIGDGERPRLRFDADRVAQRLQRQPASPPPTQPEPAVRARRSPRIPGGSPRLAFRADPELSSLHSNSQMAGRRANAPGRGAEDNRFGAKTSLPPPTRPGAGRSTPRPTPALRRPDHRR